MVFETPEKGKPRKRVFCVLADIQLESKGVYSFVNLPENALGDDSEVVVIDSPGLFLFYNTEDELLYVWNDDTNKENAIVLDTITFPLSWSNTEPYSQTLSGTYADNVEISLRPTIAQIAQLISDGVTAFTVENDNGTLTAYTLGAAPTTEMAIQCMITEVSQ